MTTTLKREVTKSILSVASPTRQFLDPAYSFIRA